jgi:tetratricopeptide (TPR) repeat protein
VSASSAPLTTSVGQSTPLALERALNGVVRRATGEYPAATQDLEQALGILRDLGHRGGEVQALNERGTLHRVTGDLAQAEGCHRQALGLTRQIGSSWDEAHALAGVGRCALAAGHATQAAVLPRLALEIFQRIGAAEVGDASRELYALTEAGPPA